MILYNIYFGTIGKTLGVKYRFTKNCKNEEEAKKVAENAATSFYYKNEGKYGIPSFEDIYKESELTGISIEALYKDHIYDMCRWYAIPSDLDSVTSSQIHY